MPKVMPNNKIWTHVKINDECLEREIKKNMCQLLDGLGMFLGMHFRHPYHYSSFYNRNVTKIIYLNRPRTLQDIDDGRVHIITDVPRNPSI
jgi:hypothetical protein